MHYVYLLKSQKDQKYYIGQTSDPERRLGEHNDGKVFSTKGRRPFDLIGTETYQSQSEARWREYQLKKSAHQRKSFVQKFIPG